MITYVSRLMSQGVRDRRARLGKSGLVETPASTDTSSQRTGALAPNVSGKSIETGPQLPPKGRTSERPTDLTYASAVRNQRPTRPRCRSLIAAGLFVLTGVEARRER
jgi:hypothetical protein